MTLSPQPQTFNIGKTAEALEPDTGNRTAYFAAFFLAIATAGGIGALWSKLPAVVPLFFTEPWGQERLVERPLLILLPGFAIVTIILNVILSRIARAASPLLPRILAVSTLVVAVALAISFLGIAQSLLL